jgi:hypothetical protein
MNLSDIPTKLPIPFASSAGGAYIHAIPTPSQIGLTPGAASLTDGFPPLTFVNTGSGGSNIDGRDMNGILYATSAWCRWAAAGANVTYDATFSGLVTGYPKGAILASASTPGVFFANLADANTVNPDTLQTNWARVATEVSNTNFSGMQTFSGSLTNFAAVFVNAKEKVDIQAAAATGTINLYLATSSIRYNTVNASGNWTLNVAFSASASLDSSMAIGESVTLCHMVRQGSTAYIASVIKIDGNTVTPDWQGGAAPAGGNPAGLDVYTFVIVKLAAATFEVMAALIQF